MMLLLMLFFCITSFSPLSPLWRDGKVERIVPTEQDCSIVLGNSSKKMIKVSSFYGIRFPVPITMTMATDPAVGPINLTLYEYYLYYHRENRRFYIASTVFKQKRFVDITVGRSAGYTFDHAGNCIEKLEDCSPLLRPLGLRGLLKPFNIDQDNEDAIVIID